MSSISKRQTGFTIVELLIVIVVIGILAAITIVAYNGVQERASQAKTVSALAAYAKALSAYAIDNEQFPVAGSCLGWQSGPTLNCLNASNDNGAACFSLGRGVNTAAFTNAVKPYLGSGVPTPSDRQYDCDGTKYTGAYYYRANATSPANIYMVISATTDKCPDISGLTTGSSTVTDSTRLCRYTIPLPS